MWSYTFRVNKILQLRSLETLVHNSCLSTEQILKISLYDNENV